VRGIIWWYHDCQSLSERHTLMMSLRITPANQWLVVVHGTGSDACRGAWRPFVNSMTLIYSPASVRRSVRPAAVCTTMLRWSITSSTTRPCAATQPPHPPRLPFLLPSATMKTTHTRQRGWNERDTEVCQCQAACIISVRLWCVLGVPRMQLRLNYARHQLIDQFIQTYTARPQLHASRVSYTKCARHRACATCSCNNYCSVHLYINCVRWSEVTNFCYTNQNLSWKGMIFTVTKLNMCQCETLAF